MGADVTTIYRYQAHCHECCWWSEELESEHAADLAADAHDEELEHHPTAGAGLAGTEGESDE